nr:MAG TPA: hypothetical protein [Caudoviricetes sp.]
MIGIVIWDMMCPRVAEIVSTTQVDARIVFLKNLKNVH